ncbi:hypothetical protein BWQ96_03261 [Gracilariopsis chorda]|uniref:Ferritin-like domain-containing protein n=1 Tax=Gracilariopsis chorda TaxID=448386 RepID=A0A2V3IXY1_9FLOR|nr:hypothetical protein BWQ96_03261 [Gracilariopsis chorda]|eukprot:PXF46923.1 hypothetical protein BWQ96_03261 [Gracilariopsis chorda]
MPALSFVTTQIPIQAAISTYASRVLTTASPLDKVRLTRAAVKSWETSRTPGPTVTPPDRPSRPVLPKIIPPSEMPSVKRSNVPSNVYYLHSLAHVELNAIDLCFDTMLRFESVLPAKDRDEWFEDWLSIASDEARHFKYLHDRLLALGSFYGELPAHDIIWKSADVSKDSLRERLALGQLVAEARGLDAGPKLAERLIGSGDNDSAATVRQIADEEVRHVQLGVKWFLKECERVMTDPIRTFHDIALRLSNPGAFAQPFNEQRRRQAGLTPEWYMPVAEEMERQRKERTKSQSTAHELRS